MNAYFFSDQFKRSFGAHHNALTACSAFLAVDDDKVITVKRQRSMGTGINTNTTANTFRMSVKQFGVRLDQLRITAPQATQ